MEHLLSTLYILWLTVFFPLWNLHALTVSCRFPLKFSTPIAREIVQITLSVCVCAVYSLCEWNHIPWNNASAIDSQFFKMALFQFNVSFRFTSFLTDCRTNHRRTVRSPMCVCQSSVERITMREGEETELQMKLKSIASLRDH